MPYIDVDVFPVRILDCWVISFHEHALDELCYGFISPHLPYARLPLSLLTGQTAFTDTTRTEHYNTVIFVDSRVVPLPPRHGISQLAAGTKALIRRPGPGSPDSPWILRDGSGFAAKLLADHPCPESCTPNASPGAPGRIIGETYEISRLQPTLPAKFPTKSVAMATFHSSRLQRPGAERAWRVVERQISSATHSFLSLTLSLGHTPTLFATAPAAAVASTRTSTSDGTILGAQTTVVGQLTARQENATELLREGPELYQTGKVFSGTTSYSSYSILI
nr:hypothetical protein CFP56_31669 [Quercus suber]